LAERLAGCLVDAGFAAADPLRLAAGFFDAAAGLDAVLGFAAGRVCAFELDVVLAVVLVELGLVELAVFKFSLDDGLDVELGAFARFAVWLADGFAACDMVAADFTAELAERLGDALAFGPAWVFTVCARVAAGAVFRLVAPALAATAFFAPGLIELVLPPGFAGVPLCFAISSAWSRLVDLWPRVLATPMPTIQCDAIEPFRRFRA